MLTEDDVVEAVCRYLQQNGYAITSRCSTRQRGVDIVAQHESGHTLRVECKGETSNQPTSKRFGKPFTANQCAHHVAVAFYTAAETLTAHPADRVAVAFPDTPSHRRHIDKIHPALTALHVTVFWVARDASALIERDGDGR